jgi:hypothetical protein
MTYLDLLWPSLILILTHFVIYIIFLRDILQTEKSIFSYFAIFYLVLLIWTFLCLLSNFDSLFIAAFIFINSINAIYCISFLELWSLSQISFSYDVLLKAKNEPLSNESPTILDLISIGNSKRSKRMDSLCNIGVMRKMNDVYILTKIGRVVSYFLSIILWMPNLKNRG